MPVYPRKSAQVESVSRPRDRDVGQACFGIVDLAGQRFSVGVYFFCVFWFCEVIGDPHGRPFSAFGLVRGGDDDVGTDLGGEPGHGLEDDVDPVVVDQVDKGQQVVSGRVLLGVFLQLAP